ncbi:MULTISPECIES: T7SS effector LXG polymorphic toxin [unclassified Oceanobacillus]|uniref:T7SS effector LXG polymorphic toxin n=1 Tax=unclassified Oceanobacillus TaxID=2630292 RepID=UPI00300E41EE
MGKKVDITEVSDLSSDVSSATADITTQLERIKSNIEQITTMDSFSGEAANQAKSYFTDLHQTVLKSFNQLFTDLDTQLKQNLQSFQSNVDSSVNTIIESNYLNETKMDVDDEFQNISLEHQSINRTIANVADITSIAAPVFSSLTNHNNRVVETIFDLEEDFTSFTSERSNRDSQIKDLLHHIEVTINRVNTQNGNARFTDYQSSSTNVGLAVLRGYADTNKQEEINNLNDDERAIIAKAEKDYENGDIDWLTYDSIISGVIATGTQFIRNAATSKLTESTSQEIARSVTHWLQSNTKHFLDLGLVAAPVEGNVQIFSEPPSSWSKIIRTGARYGVPVVGSVIDFGIQIYLGEDATDAAIKTAGHLGAGMAGAAIGSAIPVIGTFGGFLVGVGLSMTFDWIYDNSDNITKGLQNFAEGTIETVTNVGEQIGDAVSGFFNGLGSVFG